MRLKIVAAVAASVLLLAPAAAFAHGGAETGTTELVIGWAVEPAYAGFPNAVEVTAEHDGAPRNDADLQVTVLFGGADAETATDPLPLEKAFGQPGVYEASLLPTEAGTYTFHITGTVGEDEIDVTMTSGEDTFSDILATAEIQFPTTVPPVTDLRDQLAGQTEQLEAAVAAADDAQGAADGARIVALIALAVGAFSALFGFAALRRATSA